MPEPSQPRWRRLPARLILTIAMIVLGLGLAGFYGVRSARSFREFRYIHQQGLDRGAASVEAIRPWMTIRFIAVAYAVPEEYIYSALAIPFDQRNADQSLGELNKTYQLGFAPGSTELASVGKARAAITEYRRNPVATGLRDVRPWMSVRYIANSAGVPEAEIFAAVGLPAAGNESKPLEMLSQQQHYPGGSGALAGAIQKALELRKATP